MARGTATVLPTGPTTNPLRLEPGPELVDVLAGDGMLSVGDGVSTPLKEKEPRKEEGQKKATPVTA